MENILLIERQRDLTVYMNRSYVTFCLSSVIYRAENYTMSNPFLVNVFRPM